MRPAWVSPWYVLGRFATPPSGKAPYLLWERMYRDDRDGLVHVHYCETPHDAGNYYR